MRYLFLIAASLLVGCANTGMNVTTNQTQAEYEDLRVQFKQFIFKLKDKDKTEIPAQYRSQLLFVGPEVTDAPEGVDIGGWWYDKADTRLVRWFVQPGKARVGAQVEVKKTGDKWAFSGPTFLRVMSAK